MRRQFKFLIGLLASLAIVLILFCAMCPQAGDGPAPGNTTLALPSRSTATVTVEVDPGTSPTLSPVISPLPTLTAVEPPHEAIPVYTYRIVRAYPHDPNAFTQGLIYHEGVLYEGTGLRGRSTLRQVELETGEVKKLYALPPQFFGEGITIYGDKIIQLTWQSNVGFVYDKKSFELLQEFRYPTEGWGITHDGQRLIMSDGTSTLFFLNAQSFEEIGQIQVYDDEKPVVRLNELEYICGEIYANVWKTDRIARIDPQTGQVTGWIELAGLLRAEDRHQPVDVLNGIAYDAENDRLFVTGKLWPKLFQIEPIPPE